MRSRCSRSTTCPKTPSAFCSASSPLWAHWPGWLVLSEHLTLLQGLAIALVMAASMGTAWSAGQDKRVTPGSGQA
jgi:inner membrane transporter RhtA